MIFAIIYAVGFLISILIVIPILHVFYAVDRSDPGPVIGTIFWPLLIPLAIIFTIITIICFPIVKGHQAVVKKMISIRDKEEPDVVAPLPKSYRDYPQGAQLRS